jgi:hypothetical protein
VQFLTFVLQSLNDGIWFIGIGGLGAGVVLLGCAAWIVYATMGPRGGGGGTVAVIPFMYGALALFCGGVAMALWWALSFLVVYLQSLQPA